MPRPSRAAKIDRLAEIVRRLKAAYPDSRCSLDHDGPFQLLAATVLSAQCTDAAVNRATPELFRRFPDADVLADAATEEVEEAIRSVNFFRTKARSLVGLARVLRDEHGGTVPWEMHALTALPGVGRKTANVVRGVAWGLADGVVVDTHVKRVAARLGLTRQTEPEKVERDLLKLLPPGERVHFTHLVIDHGRAVCVARKPRCGVCVLADLCPSSQAATS